MTSTTTLVATPDDPDDEPGAELVATETTPDQIPPAAAPAVATYADVTSTPGQKKPLVAEHWRRDKIRETVGDRLGEHGYRVLWQALRIHITVPVNLWYALKGALILISRLIVWWHVPHLRILESEGVAKGGKEGHAQAMRAHERGLKTRASRGRQIAVCLVLAAAAVLAVVILAPWWVLPLGGLLSVPLLARYGCPEGKSLLKAATVPQRFEPPTFELIARALADAVPAIKTAVKGGKRIDFLIDVHPDGPGWGCVLNLPRGIPAGEVIRKRAELSAAGHWPLSATWPSGVPEAHEGQLDLWIGKQDLSKARQPAWPLLKSGQSDVFGTIPFATDPRSRVIRVPIFETNWMFGAAPGQGKTASVRVMGCAVALDPVADIWAHELAGKGDLDLSRVCHRYTSGIDDESIAYAAESARMLRRETEKRSAMFRKLKDAGVMPDGKVTRELAQKYKALRPLVAFFDEVQNLFMSEHGKDAAADLAFAIRVGRAMGITVVLSTQRPNKESVPTEVSGLIICKFCLMVPGQLENDFVLGTSAHRNGYRANDLRPKIDAGTGWLKGSEDGIPQIARCYYLNLDATKRVVERARVMREKAGVLSGYALGEVDETEARSFIRDVVSVFGSADKLWLESIAELLADRIPEAYDAITAEAVGSQLRSIDAALVKKVREPGREPRAGAERSALEGAASVPV